MSSRTPFPRGGGRQAFGGGARYRDGYGYGMAAGDRDVPRMAPFTQPHAAPGGRFGLGETKGDDHSPPHSLSPGKTKLPAAERGDSKRQRIDSSLRLMHSLPPRVQELLHGARLESSRVNTVAAHGWTWVVVGQQLAAWRVGSKKVVEVKLAHDSVTDALGQRACLFPVEGASREVGLLTVSSTGTVRYWPTLAQPRTKAITRLFADDEDEETSESVTSVTAFTPGQALIGCSRGSVFLVAHDVSDAGSALTCTQVISGTAAEDNGVMSRVGRLLKLGFGFGALEEESAGGSSEHEAVRAMAVAAEGHTTVVYVMTTSSVVKYAVLGGDFTQEWSKRVKDDLPSPDSISLLDVAVAHTALGDRPARVALLWKNKATSRCGVHWLVDQSSASGGDSGSYAPRLGMESAVLDLTNSATASGISLLPTSSSKSASAATQPRLLALPARLQRTFTATAPPVYVLFPRVALVDSQQAGGASAKLGEGAAVCGLWLRQQAASSTRAQWYQVRLRSSSHAAVAGDMGHVLAGGVVEGEDGAACVMLPTARGVVGTEAHVEPSPQPTRTRKLARRDGGSKSSLAAAPAPASDGALAGHASPLRLTPDKLSSAFHAYSSGKLHDAAAAMARAGFSSDGALVTAMPGAVISDVVAKLSLSIIDSQPSGGQGWVASGKTPSSDRNGVPQLVRYTLETKRQQHRQLLEFLRLFNVWQFLSPPCCHILATHGEQLEAALALALHQGSSTSRGEAPGKGGASSGGGGVGLTARGDVILAAMQAGVGLDWRIDAATRARAGLSVQDVFYSKVSKLSDVVGWLCAENEKAVSRDRGVLLGGSNQLEDDATVTASVNDAIILVLQKAHSFREQRGAGYRPADASSGSSSSAGAAGEAAADRRWTFQDRMVAWIGSQLERTRRVMADLSPAAASSSAATSARGMHSAGPPGAGVKKWMERLGRQLADLVDCTLLGYRDVADSAASLHGEVSQEAEAMARAYGIAKEKLLGLLEHFRLHEAALRLADKYRHFPTLVRVCDSMDSRNASPVAALRDGFDEDDGTPVEQRVGGVGGSKLLSYARKLGQPFVDYLVAWYLQQGRGRGANPQVYFSRVLAHTSQTFAPTVQSQLLHGRHLGLAGVHALGLAGPGKASSLLCQEAVKEVRSAPRARTLLSIGKLAAVAAGKHGEADSAPAPAVFDSHLHLIAAAERVGLMGGVSTAAEVARECVSAERLASEHGPTFLALALEVVQKAKECGRLTDGQVPEVVADIWCHCILADLGVLERLAQEESSLAAREIEDRLTSTLLYSGLIASARYPATRTTRHDIEKVGQMVRSRAPDTSAAAWKHVHNIFQLTSRAIHSSVAK